MNNNAKSEKLIDDSPCEKCDDTGCPECDPEWALHQRRCTPEEEASIAAAQSTKEKQ